MKTGVVLFNHRNGCQQCATCGEYSRDMHRMSFPELECARRTNETFRNRSQSIHHKDKTLFEDLDIDMIAAFPTSDPLHLLDLGVMRRCLYRWVFGTKNYGRKWSKSLVHFTSQLLERCQQQMPMDIHRAVRNLNYLRYWKGVEYRTILLYVGIVVFKQVLVI